MKKEIAMKFDDAKMELDRHLVSLLNTYGSDTDNAVGAAWRYLQCHKKVKVQLVRSLVEMGLRRRLHELRDAMRQMAQHESMTDPADAEAAAAAAAETNEEAVDGAKEQPANVAKRGPAMLEKIAEGMTLTLMATIPVIGTGKLLGEATGRDLDVAIKQLRTRHEGVLRRLLFFQTVRSKVGDQKQVQEVLSEEDVRGMFRRIEKQKLATTLPVAAKRALKGEKKDSRGAAENAEKKEEA